MTFTVQKPADLDAMRSALSSQVSFFEADLTAFTTTRALQQAAESSKGRDIPFQSPFPGDDPVMAAKRPCWADDSCGGDWFTDARAEVCPTLMHTALSCWQAALQGLVASPWL